MSAPLVPGSGTRPRDAGEPAPPPARPLVPIAGAAIAGALVGGGERLFGLAALALVAWNLRSGFGGGPRARTRDLGEQHPGEPEAQPGDARARGRGPSGPAVAVLLVFGLSAGRAAVGADPRPHDGARWRVRSERSEEVRGMFGTSKRTRAATLPAGAAADGELVRVLPSGEPRRPARGPVGERRELPLEPRADEIVRLAPGPVRAGPWSALRTYAARAVEERIAPSRRPFVRALLFGRTDALDWETRDLFVRTGSRHLLAVSGLHVVLFGALVAGPLARLVTRLSLARTSRPTEAILKALALVLYVPFAGGGAPVTRAACALALTWVAPPLAGRRADGRSVLAVAALVELGLDPRAPLDVGVQLSYAATTALVTLYGSVRARLAARLDRFVPSATNRVGRPRLRTRAVALALARTLTSAWAAALVASGATLPIVWAWFGEWSPLEILVAPVTVPLLAAWLAAAWAELSGWPLPESCLDAPREGLLGLLRALDAAPGTPLLLPERPAWILALVAALAAVALARPFQRAPQRARRRSDPRARAALGAAGLLVLPWHPGPRGLEVVALDVGHGTAVLIRAPGEPIWIFDAGSRDRGAVARDALAPLLRHWDAGAPVVCLSHADRDHQSALEWVVQRTAPARWIGAALPALSNQRPPRTDLESGRVELASRGPARFRLTRGVDVEGNEGSRTLSISSPEGWVHLCGDAEEEGLGTVLDRGHLCGPARLLLFPHHGSMGMHVRRLLETTRPVEVWISSAERPAIGDELDRRGLRWFSTAASGPLVWESSASTR